MKNVNIQDELKELVSKSVKLLGLSVQEVYGAKLYQKIEDLRLKMKKVRGKEADTVQSALSDVYKILKKDNNDELQKIAKAFSLMLELINTCESAYRTHQLHGYQVDVTTKPHSIIYVFTSHPTESRSHDFLLLMGKIEDLLIESLAHGFESIEERLHHLLKISVRIHLANNRRPQVKDEIEQIFYTVLAPKILDEQVKLKQLGLDVLFRTWVGGDKDGHPFVNKQTMLQSLSFSRKKLLEYVNAKIKVYAQELQYINEGPKLKKSLMTFRKGLQGISVVKAGDGKKIKILRKNLESLLKVAKASKLLSPDLSDIESIFWLYPAIVLPLEVREDSELIHKALKNSRAPIAQMLTTLKSISLGMEAKWYVRGFVISMCQTPEDFLAAAMLDQRILGKQAIPVIPLFENEKGLLHATQILTEGFKKFPFVKNHKAKWGSRFEVMLGYSDSSKENGVLPARLMVEKALLDLEKVIEGYKLTPVFFHGSGGSTSRGGGTVQEQIAWWPKSALNIFKVTTQGEMVQRNFNGPLIMRSQVGKIVKGYSEYKPLTVKKPQEVQTFSDLIQNSYRELVKDPSFQELVALATPYDYLNLLKIGSRPTKRGGNGTFSLRAIPWILCWTQTRLLLPVWWGTGTGWSKLDNKEKKHLKEYYKSSPLMQSYVKNLGFTFAKIEMGVWHFHIQNSKLSDENKKIWKETILKELDLSIQFFKDISGEKNFTWFRPWLGESIHFRSSMIHPLNVIQKLALERKDHSLLRETVTGIACGMLTTG